MESGREHATEADLGPNRPSRRPWPLGLLGMLILIGAVEVALTRQPDLAHPWAVDWSLAVRKIPSVAPTGRILCFGDSLMKYGVNAPILADRLKRPTYNFALGACPPPVTLAMLRQALDAGARPDAILVDFTPHILAQGNFLTAQLLPEVLRPLDIVQYAWDARDPALAARLLLARFFPSVRKRLEAREAVAAALAGDPRIERAANLEAGRRNWRLNAGSYVSARSNRPPGDDLPYDLAFYPTRWHVDPVNVRMVRRFFRLADEHKIPVFWVIPPFSPEVHARRRVEGQDRLYDEFVERMRVRFPTVTVIDGRLSDYAANVHSDPFHLDRRGAAIFTEDLAAVVGQRLGHPAALGSRVALPPFRDRPVDAGLEDNLQSRVAVAKQFEDPTRR